MDIGRSASGTPSGRAEAQRSLVRDDPVLPHDPRAQGARAPPPLSGGARGARIGKQRDGARRAREELGAVLALDPSQVQLVALRAHGRRAEGLALLERASAALAVDLKLTPLLGTHAMPPVAAAATLAQLIDDGASPLYAAWALRGAIAAAGLRLLRDDGTSARVPPRPDGSGGALARAPQPPPPEGELLRRAILAALSQRVPACPPLAARCRRPRARHRRVCRRRRRCRRRGRAAVGRGLHPAIWELLARGGGGGAARRARRAHARGERRRDRRRHPGAAGRAAHAAAALLRGNRSAPSRRRSAACRSSRRLT